MRTHLTIVAYIKELSGTLESSKNSNKFKFLKLDFIINFWMEYGV